MEPLAILTANRALITTLRQDDWGSERLVFIVPGQVEGVHRVRQSDTSGGETVTPSARGRTGPSLAPHVLAYSVTRMATPIPSAVAPNNAVTFSTDDRLLGRHFVSLVIARLKNPNAAINIP